jgi:hypothetical protein
MEPAASPRAMPEISPYWEAGVEKGSVERTITARRATASTVRRERAQADELLEAARA